VAFDRNAIMCCATVLIIWKKKPDSMKL